MLLRLGWLPAVGCAQARRVVLGVAGSLWGSGPVPCAGVRCRGAARAGYPPPPYSWGRVGLRSWQVMLGVPGSLWPRGVVLVVVAPPVWTHGLVRALWCAGPRCCRIACRLRGVSGVLLVWFGGGVGGAEVDGLGDVEDVAANVRVRTFVALVAVMARDQCGGVVMVVVVLRGE